MITYTLFGTTTGLKLVHFPFGESSNQGISFEDAWIEVPPQLVTLAPDNDATVVMRRTVDSQTLTWIGIYRSAREIGYDRLGGCVGVGAWCLDASIPTKPVLEVLRTLLSQLQDRALIGDKFHREIRDLREDFTFPPEAVQLAGSLNRASAGCSPDGATAFIGAEREVADIVTWAQTAQSAAEFSRIAIASPNQAPEAGRGGSTRVYRSLARAIEGAYLLQSAEVTSWSERAERALRDRQEMSREKGAALRETETAQIALDIKQAELEAALRKYDEVKDECEKLKKDRSSIARSSPFPPAKANGSNAAGTPPQRAAADFPRPTMTHRKMDMWDKLFYYLLGVLTFVAGVAVVLIYHSFQTRGWLP